MSRNSWLVIGLVLGIGSGFAVFDSIDAPSITAEPVKAVVPPQQPTKTRNDFNEQLKKMEMIEQNLKDELEASERQMRLMVKANGGLGDERIKGLQTHLSELERELAHLDIERLLADADQAVIKKQLDSGPKVDALLIMLAVKSDPRIALAVSARDKAAEALSKAGKFGSKAEVIKEFQMELADAEETLLAKKKMVAVDVEETEKARMTLQLKDQLESLERKISINGMLRDKMKSDREMIQKTIAASAESKVQVESITATLVPLREAIAKVRSMMIQLRIDREFAPEK